MDCETIKSLNRDFADINALSQCQGTEKMVESRIRQMRFEIKTMGLTEAEINQLNKDFKEISELKKN